MTTMTIEDYVEEYLKPGNLKTISYFASKLNVNGEYFERYVENYKQRKFHMNEESKVEASKGFPVMAHALMKAESKVEDDDAKKTRKRLTSDQRAQVVRDVLEGNSHATVALIYEISTATVANIMSEHRKEQLNKTTGSTISTILDTKETPSIEKLIEASEIGVSIEGDYFVLKIPKNRLTRELLKGVL